MMEAETVSESLDLDPELIEKTMECMGNIAAEATSLKDLVLSLKHKLTQNQMNSSEFESSSSNEQGFSLLDMKNKVLVEYLENLVYLVLCKSTGKSIQGSPSIDYIVENRTVLEKIRPIEQKSQYQINKLVKAALQGKVGNDPLSYKANLDDLESGNDESAEEDESKPDNKSEIYKPPKVAPQHFEEEMEMGVQTGEKLRKRQINKTLIRELQEEVLETPVEIHNMGDAYSKQLSKEKKDKQRYEETYMTRLPVTKREKHLESKHSTLGVLGDEVTDFSSGRNPRNSEKSRKRKAQGKKAKGGKKKFRK